MDVDGRSRLICRYIRPQMLVLKEDDLGIQIYTLGVKDYKKNGL